MKKFLFLIFIFNIIAIFSYAEIPIATLLLNENIEVGYKEIKIQNIKEQSLEPESGLTLYKGDALSSNSESLVLLFPSASIIITVSPYTELKFDVLSLGSQEFVLQLIVLTGELKAELHPRQDILQVLQGIVEPTSEVIRIDGVVDTSKSALKTYLQIINIDGNIETKNFDLKLDVFLTGPNIDIKELIDTLKNNSVDNEAFKKILVYPTEKPELISYSDIKLIGLFYDWFGNQAAVGVFNLYMQKEKFKIGLNFPFLYARDHSVYSPLGNHDLDFGILIGRDRYEDYDAIVRAGVGIQSSIVSLLNRVNYVSYGTPSDNIYVYFGNQKTWHNPRTSLFAYHYIPIRTMYNNFNPDFNLELNMIKFGNTTRMRYFQVPKMEYSALEKFDLLYNRMWTKPFFPFSTTEIGLTFAYDFSINKFSEEDNDYYVNDIGTDSNQFMYWGLDVSVPVIDTYRLQLEVQTEGGILFPISVNGIDTPEDKIDSAMLTNFGTKGGVWAQFANPSRDFQFGFAAQGYFSRGFFRPHIVSTGYEYILKPTYNRLVSRFAKHKTDDVFQTFVFTPEAEFFFHAPLMNLELGAYYPISLGGSLADLYLHPSLFLDLSVNFARVLPSYFNVEISFFYSHPNLNFAEWDYLSYFTKLSSPYSISNISVLATVLEIYLIEIGVYNTPKYSYTTGNDLLYFSETSLPEFMTIPYISFSVRF